MDFPDRRLYFTNKNRIRNVPNNIYYPQPRLPSYIVCNNRNCMLEGHNHFQYSPCISRFKID